MLPNYERFYAEAGFGDVSVLKDAIDTALTWIESGRLPDNLAALRTACEQQAPDTEHFHSLHTSAALDAANVATIILDAPLPPATVVPLREKLRFTSLRCGIALTYRRDIQQLTKAGSEPGTPVVKERAEISQRGGDRSEIML